MVIYRCVTGVNQVTHRPSTHNDPKDEEARNKSLTRGQHIAASPLQAPQAPPPPLLRFLSFWFLDFLSFLILYDYTFKLIELLTHTPNIDISDSKRLWCWGLLIKQANTQLYKALLSVSNDKDLMMATAGRNM